MNGSSLMKLFRVYPVALVSFSVSVILLLIIYVRGTAGGDLKERFEAAQGRWGQVEVNVFKNSVNLETHLENAKEISQDVKERLIRPSELAKNYQYFYRLEASTGVRISSLQQQPAQPMSQGNTPAGGGKAPAAEPLFSKVGYTMAMSGSFHETLDLVHALEGGLHFYQLKDFTLQRSTLPEDREITVTMNFDLLGTP